jgi:nucleoid-associated protein YgaU
VSQDTGRGGGRDSGRHASRGNNERRDTRATAVDRDYTVRPGDNLWAIADAQKVPGGWSALYEANKGAVGGDPDLILPGQSLDLDAKAK